MKKRKQSNLFFMMLFLFLAVPALSKTVLAAEEPLPRTIRTNGQGILTVEPDTATISLGVESQGTTSAEARDKNSVLMQQVIDSIQSHGMKEEDIKTEYFRIYPRYHYDEQGNRTIVSYSATNTISVKTSDIDNAVLIMDDAISAGANENGGIHYSVSNPTKYYQDALKLAIVNARKNAAAISEGLGVPLGTAVNVIEESYGISYEENDVASSDSAVPESKAMYSGGTTNIYYNKIQITARVSVVFSF